MRPRPDYALYLVTDSGLACRPPLFPIVEAAIAGGVSIVQLREKNCSTREFVRLARQLKKRLEKHGVPLIINDRVDVALAAGADGVHVGQCDMAYRDVRRLLGEDAIVGLSVESFEQAAEAEAFDVDYLGVSPIFETPTKTDTGNPWGVEGLRALRVCSRHKLVAIGGINETNVGQIVQAGADGVAVVSAIFNAPNPHDSARRLRVLIDEGMRAS